MYTKNVEFWAQQGGPSSNGVYLLLFYFNKLPTMKSIDEFDANWFVSQQKH